MEIRIENNETETGLVMGRMIDTTWNYSNVPQGISGMKIALETWFAQMMKKNQPTVEYTIEYADNVIFN